MEWFITQYDATEATFYATLSTCNSTAANGFADNQRIKDAYATRRSELANLGRYFGITAVKEVEDFYYIAKAELLKAIDAHAPKSSSGY